LTISLTAASYAGAEEAQKHETQAATAQALQKAEPAAQAGNPDGNKQPDGAKKAEKKASRGKRFWRSVGSFSAGMLVTDPYSDVQPTTASAVKK
jgi:hypothetical protein